MSPRRVGLAAAAALLASSLSALARPGRGPIDERLRLLFQHRDRTGETLPFFARSPAFEHEGRAPVLLRLRRAPSHDERAKLEAAGLSLGQPLASGAVRASASLPGLLSLEASGLLVRASCALPPRQIALPLDAARGEVGVTAGLAALRASIGKQLDGSGVVVGDLDGPVDPYHPAFFRPLAPVEWVDVDGDLSLTPGVDGVDLDGDGEVAPREVLRLLDGRARSIFASDGAIDGTDSAGLDPGWDYLYLDLDGDGRRGAGPELIGADALPSLGEPLYAADDVDGDGRIGRSERVVPLGSSKLRAVAMGGQVYRRGAGLGAYPPAPAAGAGAAGEGWADHATMVLGQIAGGQGGISRFLGLAPGSDLVLSSITPGDAQPLTDKLSWLREQGAEVIVTEVGLWGAEPADGSTELEALIDALVDGGAVVVSPSGNLAASGKHALAAVPSGGESWLGALVSSGPSPSSLSVAITWREGEAEVEGEIELSGEVFPFGNESGSGSSPKGVAWAVSSEKTPKGAGFIAVALGAKGSLLPPEGAPIRLRSKSGGPAHASLFVTDGSGQWQGGARFEKGDEAGSMVSPSFAKKTIAVAAYALHAGAEWSFFPAAKPGALRPFSGRGPDVFGDDGVDVAAPDNAVGAVADRYLPEGASGERTRYAEGGGTSGAGAVVAGLAALLRQARPDLTGASLRQQVLSGAREDDEVASGSPSAWGAGKLGLGVAPAPGGAPKVSIKGPKSAEPGAELSLEALVEGDADGAVTRWDVGYDGSFDTEPQASRTLLTTMPPGGGALSVLCEVQNAHGWAARASLRVEAPSTQGADAGAPAAGGTGGGGEGGRGPADGGARAPGAEGEGRGCGCRLSGSRGGAAAGLVWVLAWGSSLLRRGRGRRSRR